MIASRKAKLTQVLAAILARLVWDQSRAWIASRTLRGNAPPAVPRTSFHQMDRGVRVDPYPGYRELLASGPVHFNERQNLWILSRYEHVRAAARADEALSSADGVARSRFSLPMMLTSDRPEHTRMRRLATPAFTRRALESWHPTIDQLATELVGELEGSPDGDAVAHLAAPLPVRLIAHILGIPPEDHADFRCWSNMAVESADLDISLAGLTSTTNVLGGLFKLNGYFHEQLAAGRLLEPDTVLGRLVTAADDGAISADELFWFAILLLLAGHETTTNMLGGLIHSLAMNPDQYDVLRERPELIPAAVEEQLRYVAPIQGFYRTALRDYDVDSVTIPRGARVLLLFAAANRDPRQYSDPDQFLVERNPTGHMAFGFGIHMCLGAQLARMEGQAVLRELLARARRIELTGDPVWSTNSVLRGLTTLPVRLVR